MKNNILLILAVTIISIGIIIATVLISGAGNNATETNEATQKQATTTEPLDIDSAEPVESTTTPIYIEPEVTTTDAVSEEVPKHNSEMADSIIATAHSLIGIDFADGGDTPGAGFDNSGFIYYVLRENGYITCPRGLSAQSGMGAVKTYDELKAGDLVFFYDEMLEDVGFGGIYCGDGVMVACLMPGTQVKEINITTPYYQKHFYRGISVT